MSKATLLLLLMLVWVAPG